MRQTQQLLSTISNLRFSILAQSINRAKLYSDLGAKSPKIIRLAGLCPGQFGYQSEHILIQRLGLNPRLKHEHDAICPSTGLRIEIKCARFVITTTPENLIYTWTRIYPDHAKFDILLLCLLDLEGFKIWELSHPMVLELISSNSLQQQKTTIRHYQLLTPEKIKVLL